MATTLGRTTKYVGPRQGAGYDGLYAKRQPAFFAGSSLKSSGGVASLAAPCWTIVPDTYFSPTGYNFKAIEESGEDVEDESLVALVDDLGSHWAAPVISTDTKESWSQRFEVIASKVKIALRKRDERDFTAAAHYLGNAFDALTPQERLLLPGVSLLLHSGHALLRASLQDNPARCLDEARAAFNRCQEGAKKLAEHDGPGAAYAKEVWAAGLQGDGWCKLIASDVEAAREAFQCGRALQVSDPDAGIYAAWGLAAVEMSIGNIEEAGEWLDKKHTGYKLSDIHLYFYDLHVGKEKGKFYVVFIACSRDEFQGERGPEGKRLKDELLAGLLGDNWFRIGAYQEALAAYARAAESADVLVRAAGYVGGANSRAMLLKQPQNVGGGWSASTEEGALDAPETQARLRDEALTLYAKALQIYERLGHRHGQAGVLCNLGRLQLEARLMSAAEESFGSAERLVGKVDVALACNRAELLTLQGQFGRAVTLLDSCAHVLAEARASDLAVALVKLQAGRIAMEAVRKGESVGAPESRLESAIALFARAQTDLQTLDSVRVVLFEQQKQAYTLLQEGAARRGRARDVLCWAEKGRSRAMMWLKWEECCEDDADVARLRSLGLREFDELDPESACEALGEWKTVTGLKDTAVVEYTVCPGYGVITCVLNGGKEPALHVVRFGACEGVSAASAEELEALVFSTVALCSKEEPTAWETAEAGAESLTRVRDAGLRRLYEILIQPVIGHLQGVKHLVICPHEVLFKVPFPVLIGPPKPDGSLGPFLIERVSLSLSDSVRSLMLCALLARKQARVSQESSKSRVALVAGIKEHRTVDLADLEYAEVEATKVAEILRAARHFGAVEEMLGMDADYMQRPTKDATFLANLDRAYLVHLATHGFINSRYEEGGILLAAHQTDTSSAVPVDQKPQHALRFGAHSPSVLRSTSRAFSAEEAVRAGVILTAEEIAHRKMRAALVVLSACDTATGVIAGEGVVGLGRALLTAGTPCSLLSQWPVNDKTAGDLMALFYSRLVAGEPVARSIRAAMLDMMKEEDGWIQGRRMHGLNRWAAFVPYGFPSISLAEREDGQGRSNEPLGLEPEAFESRGVMCLGFRAGLGMLLAASFCAFLRLRQKRMK